MRTPGSSTIVAFVVASLLSIAIVPLVFGGVPDFAEIEPTSGLPGTKVFVNGDPCGRVVVDTDTVWFATRPNMTYLASVPLARNGAQIRWFVIPEITPGSYTLVAGCADTNQQPSIEFAELTVQPAWAPIVTAVVQVALIGALACAALWLALKGLQRIAARSSPARLR